MIFTCQTCHGIFNCDEEKYEKQYHHPCEKKFKQDDENRTCVCKDCYDKRMNKDGMSMVFECLPCQVDLEKVS